MKDLVTLLLAALIVAAGYGFSKNPKGCQKLGSDVAHDLTVIFTPPNSTPSAQDGTAVAVSTASAAVASPIPPPVVAPESTAPAAAPAASAPAAPAIPPAPPISPALASLPNVAPAASPAPDLGDVVSAPGVFSYQAPKGWSVQDSSVSRYKVAMDERRDDFAANINVATDSYPNSLPEYIKLSKEQLAATPAIQNAKVVEEKPFATTSGLEGVRVTVLDTAKNIALQQVFYFFEGSGDAKYVVVCTSLAGEGARLEPTFDASMKSFTLP
jgi:hypothetical protein